MCKEIFAIPKAKIVALVKDILKSLETPEGGGFSMTRDAAHVFHTVTEVAAVEALSLWNKSAIHAKRVTVQLSDIQHVRAMCHDLSLPFRPAS